jgi:hypothetical protein
MKEIKKKLKSPLFFISMATVVKFVLPIPILFAYLIPLDVDVTGNIHKNDHSRLLAKQKLMKLDRNNIHI